MSASQAFRRLVVFARIRAFDRRANQRRKLKGQHQIDRVIGEMDRRRGWDRRRG